MFAGMRLNILPIAGVLILAGLSAIFLTHNPWVGGFLVVVGIAYVPLHFIRLRRFKRHDDAHKFD
jgi:hypothetical protein